MAANESYREMLSKWCGVVNPKRILEYGPGESTKLMKMLCPNAEILSIEHNPKYFVPALKELENDIVHIVLNEAPEEDRNSSLWDNYVEQRGMYDLIFIDGRERVRCLIWAAKHLNPNGVILLHDAERLEYKNGIEQFYKLEEWGGTVVLRPR